MSRPVSPSPTPRWSRATTGNSDSTLKAKAFMMMVNPSRLRIIRLLNAYRTPDAAVARKLNGPEERAGTLALTKQVKNNAIPYSSDSSMNA